MRNPRILLILLLPRSIIIVPTVLASFTPLWSSPTTKTITTINRYDSSPKSNMISFVDRNSPLMPRTFLLPPLFSDRNNRIIRWKKYENSGWLSSQRKWYQAAYAPEEIEFTTGSTENVNENNGGVVAGDDDLFTEEKRKIEKGANRRRRKMELSWCGPESCKIDAIRETIVGDDHHIKFEGPATGQVVYKWVSDDVVVDDGKLDNSKGEMVEGVLAKVETSSVLVLVKWNDDELLRVAADVSCIILIRIIVPPSVFCESLNLHTTSFVCILPPFTILCAP